MGVAIANTTARSRLVIVFNYIITSARLRSCDDLVVKNCLWNMLRSHLTPSLGGEPIACEYADEPFTLSQNRIMDFCP